MQDLAPSIYRQRAVIEGRCVTAISREQISDYLTRLSVVLDMSALTDAVTHLSERYGWAGWIHWETSGAHFYAWDQPFVFFSVDVYTCKAFDVEKAVEFTRDYFDATQVAYKSV